MKKYSDVFVYKKGLLISKKTTVSLFFDSNIISGTGLKKSYTSNDYEQSKFNLEISTVKDCTLVDFSEVKSIQLTAQVDRMGTKYIDTYVLPIGNKNDIDTVYNEINECFNEHINRKKKIEEFQNERLLIQREQEEKERQRQNDITNFYNATYDFHIKENTPMYTLFKRENECSIIYIGDDKSINLLAIDGEKKYEVHGVIKYEEIHYYERAGQIHYATNINADYIGSESFGGSFTGGNASVGATILGGLLFGTMGMAVGAMASYKTAQYIPPTYTPSKLNIKSEIARIDERSVILNYYSEKHKQYIDIELPQDIFNLMQTYLPNKKYDIVIELEKQNATQNIKSEDTVIARLQKLKQLYEMELISKDEYAERKKEILCEV